MINWLKLRRGIKDVATASQLVGNDIRTQSLIFADDLTAEQKSKLAGINQELQQLNRRAADLERQLGEVEASTQEPQSGSTQHEVDRWKTKQYKR